MKANQFIVRDSNFELLRIISMFMVVFLHVGTFGIQKYLNINEDFSSYDFFIYHFLRSCSIVAVNVYILIGAYFLCESNFKIIRVVRLFIETSFFAVVLFVFSLLLNIISFDINMAKESLFAVIYKEYWFVTTYFLLVILSPFLNKLIYTLTKKEHQLLILILFVTSAIWDFNVGLGVFGVGKGYSLFSFIFLYFVGSYIRKYGVNSVKNHNYFLLFFIGLAFVNTFIINTKLLNGESYGQYYAYSSPIVIFMSCFLLLYFKGLKIKSTKINNLAKFSFGIYLIHEYPPIRQALWIDSGIVQKVLDLETKFSMPPIILFTVVTFIILFILSFILSTIFNKIFDYINYVFFSKANS